MVETRSQEMGKPLIKPGGYNTDNYYQGKDDGYGDVGVNQEPDAGTLDDKEDPSYEPSKDDTAPTDAAADENLPEGGDPNAMRAEAEDLQASGGGGGGGSDASGEPVPIVSDEDAAGEVAQVDAASVGL